MPPILWDEGTGYDFFVSLYVLHHPVVFGLRPSWAAGVRSRLPAKQRDFLEKAQSFLPVPLSWLYLLPAEAKNAAGALFALAQLPAAERLPSLLFTADTPIEAINVLREITLRQSWSSAEQEVLRAALNRRDNHTRPRTLNHVCEAWCDLSTTGELYLQALTTYYEVFFAEEEERIRLSLRAAHERAVKMAEQISLPQLLAELSHGVHFEAAQTAQEVILVPSFWSSPLVFYSQVITGKLLVLFGSRAGTEELVPGDAVPRNLVEAMKAIADPTRLRILHYLAEGPLTPGTLAHRLRLRPPTVSHHLNILRLSGLVEVILYADGERGYTLRQDALQRALHHLNEFLSPT